MKLSEDTWRAAVQGVIDEACRTDEDACRLLDEVMESAREGLPHDPEGTPFADIKGHGEGYLGVLTADKARGGVGVWTYKASTIRGAVRALLEDFFERQGLYEVREGRRVN